MGILKLLGSAIFALLSLEINWQECKAFWRICTRDIPLQYRNRRNLQLKHQENPENLFLEMLSRNTELMESMDMMPPVELLRQGIKASINFPLLYYVVHVRIFTSNL